jgi:penicillin-binding protein 1A
MIIRALFTGLFLITAFCMGAFFAVLNYHVLDFSVLEHYEPGRPSIVLDDEGHELFRFQLDRREPIPLEQLPSHVINAFLAAEDWQFFSHSGISLKGILRSTLVNLYHRRKMQGASTITQQLVKLLFFDTKKTFSRKVKEQLYALVIEQQFSKEYILENYLNHIFFGCGIYGVQAASQRFWNKDAAQLTVDEAATLAGIIRNPGHYCPLLYPLSCQKRRNIVLHSMKRLNFITQKVYEESCAKKLAIKEAEDIPYALHVKEMIRQFLEEKVGKQQLYAGGLTIQTTINRSMQKAAERIFKQRCIQLRTELGVVVDGALFAMHPRSGEIKALVGGADFATSKFNRALQAHRQMGSIFKPLIYAVALEQGMTFADTEIDEPITITQGLLNWSPHNYNLQFEGQMTLAYALSHSNNIVPVKLLLRLGVQAVIERAKQCRINATLNPYPSLALGCVDATMLEAIGMFNIFANAGMYVEPYYIVWIKDQWGNKIWRNTPERERIMSTRVACQVAKVLTLSCKRIRAMVSEPWVSSEAIIKTGTTNDSRTCWFMGAVPDLITAVYIGCDDNRSLGHNIYPVRTALPIWLAFNKTVECCKAGQRFSYDPNLREIVVNERTGALVSETDPEAIKILI